MSLQDKTVVRTAADLEKKYNFAKLLGLSSNVETNSEELIKVQNELTNMLNTLIINLGDVLDSQTDISLWFYSGIPTTTNQPYISWVNPTDHIGDIYYDQNSGYVYKYTSIGWIQQDNENLIQAMAITDVDIDTTDHERKVYISKPIPPYSSGDWWILEDGTLKICQLGRATGEFDDEDFIVSNRYTPTIASVDGDIIAIKQGQVIKMSDTFASFTDLATGGNTTIAGENITTGNIKSANYVQGTSGTNINLTNGKISTPNVTIDVEGMKLSNGAKVVGNNGLKNTYLYDNMGFIGVWKNEETETITNQPLKLSMIIPKGLEVTKAVIRIFHNPVHWGYYNWETRQYYCYDGGGKRLIVKKATNLASRTIHANYYGEYYESDTTSYSNIGVTWYNSSGQSIGSELTPALSGRVEAYTSDFSNQFKQNGVTVPGQYEFIVDTAEAISQSWSVENICNRNGLAEITLELEGYMTYS